MNGSNGVLMYILKFCTTIFSDKLADILNLAFKTGIFPYLCKLAKHIPVFKKDDLPLLCVNYHHISLLPIFSKIFEKLIHNRMYSFLDVNKLISSLDFVAITLSLMIKYYRVHKGEIGYRLSCWRNIY